MNNISQEQLLYIWTELDDAYYGTNGYGSTTAEIYAHRVMPNDPAYEHYKQMQMNGQDSQIKDWAEERMMQAGESLYQILQVFKKKRNCIIKIEDGEVFIRSLPSNINLT